MLLDLAGLDKNQKNMIQSSIGNARDFDKIAGALLVQHPRIHIGEKSNSNSIPARKPQGKGKGKGRKAGRGKGKFKGYRRTANIANEAGPQSQWSYDYPEEDQPQAAYYATDAIEEPYTDPAYWSVDEGDDYDEHALNHNESIEDWPEEEYQDDGFEAYVAKEL